MIEAGISKRRGVMAQRAILGRSLMNYRICHPGRCHTIVARRTVINDTAMIEHRCGKGAGYVTDTAIFSGRDVTGMLLGHCTRTIITMTF